jgi:DNA-3-methyladenine glycosylase II
LTPESYAWGLAHLAGIDGDLGQVLADHGSPPVWQRPTGFQTLIHIILEQQVSVASAQAALNKLLQVLSPLTPQGFLALDDAVLRQVGFSRQKAGYSRLLAEAIAAGRFDPAALQTMDDTSARAALLQLKGIGVWSAEIYLLMALLRPDAWPVGDLALAVAARTVKRLAAVPGAAELEALALPWRPWRAVAARILWHDYLSHP